MSGQWSGVMLAIQTAVADAAGLVVGAVEWADTGHDGDWIAYPRIKLTPVGNGAFGLPQEQHTWNPTTQLMSREVWAVGLFRVQVRIECDQTALGVGAGYAPAARLAAVIRTPDVRDPLNAAGVSVHEVREFGPFQVFAENRELSCSVAEIQFQVNAPVDTTPQGGVDWFNIVPVHINEGVEFMPDLTIYGLTLEALLIPGAGLRLYRPSTLIVRTSGADVTTPLILPAALPLVVGHRYRISGVILVRSGSIPIAAIATRDHVVTRGVSTWTEDRAGDEVEQHFAGWETYFATSDDLPGLGFIGLTLNLTSRPVMSLQVTVEFAGTIADIGAS